MKFLQNQKGFTGLEIVLLVVILGSIGFVGYRAYQAKNQQSPAPQEQAAKQEPNGQASKAKEDTSTHSSPDEEVTAAAGTYCKTREGADSFESGTIGVGGKKVLYAQAQQFALINGACLDNGERISGGARFLLKAQGSKWSVIFVGQDSGFPESIVKQYNVPAEETFK
ncbi:MAG TPA: hypothetical protein VK963_01780 [Candidatus Saccharimonadales bacterium]|nr:hypothetical protein [Candidatus Saccharimonadales bacterium]